MSSGGGFTRVEQITTDGRDDLSHLGAERAGDIRRAEVLGSPPQCGGAQPAKAASCRPEGEHGCQAHLAPPPEDIAHSERQRSLCTASHN
jgi:hypothetical protein